jgi:Protein of unknown function (DUF3309)
MGTVLLIVLIILLLASVPRYPYSRTWGYGPSGLVALLLIVLLFMLFLGNVPWLGWTWGPPPGVR